MKTVREVLATDIDTSEVEVITISKLNSSTNQFDSIESIPDNLLDAECVDYEIDYDADMSAVFLDIICI